MSLNDLANLGQITGALAVVISLWIGWEQVLMNLIGAPGGKSLWKERAYLFGEEFRRHVEDDLIKRTPHPDAKPLGAFSIGGITRQD